MACRTRRGTGVFRVLRGVKSAVKRFRVTDQLFLAGGIVRRFLGEVEPLPAADAVLVSLARLLDGHEHEVDQESYLQEDVEAV